MAGDEPFRIDCPECGREIPVPWWPARSEPYTVSFTHHKRGRANCRLILRVYPDSRYDVRAVPRQVRLEDARSLLP